MTAAERYHDCMIAVTSVEKSQVLVDPSAASGSQSDIRI